MFVTVFLCDFINLTNATVLYFNTFTNMNVLHVGPQVHIREVALRVGFLRRIHIFRGWSKERLEDLATALTSQVCGSNAVIATTKQSKYHQKMYSV